MLALVGCAAVAWQSTSSAALAPRHASTASRVAGPPTANLIVGAGLAIGGSTAALVSLNIAQNGPDTALSYQRIMDKENVPLTFEGPPVVTSNSGYLASEIFHPTDTAPDCLEDLLTLRTKADVVRAWRNGAAPALPGQNGIEEVYDAAMIRRGILAPCSALITHRLFGPVLRWRGKAFGADGCGTNRFGGGTPNYFGRTGRDAREIMRVIKAVIRARKASLDPLMQITSPEECEPPPDADARLAALRGPADTEGGGAEEQPEERRRAFAYSIGPSRLDGQPALICEYASEESGDALWGRALGMRDEIREVAPGVLLGLGSMRATGGVRNNAPFVMVRASQDGE